MIEKLKFNVTFPPTDHYPMGRKFDRDLTFERGMTNIVGPNETGKTFVLEMIEFLLFGSKALRGKTEDYKHLSCQGTVTIRGTGYLIERTVRNAALRSFDGTAMVVGTTPVNKRILQTLGYGLDVFRVANIANQGDADRLSKMSPTERKAMVDKLIGADQLQAIATWCGTEALGVSREIKALEGVLVEPVKPEKPADYAPDGELKAEIARLRTVRDNITKWKAFLANEPVVSPLEDEPTRIPLDTLRKAEELLQARTYSFNLPTVVAQQEAYDLHQEFLAFQRAHPLPTINRNALERANERRQIEADLVRLRKSPVMTCPCGKPFTTADAEIARLEGELAANEPIQAQVDLGQEANRLDDWDRISTKAGWQRLVDHCHTVEQPRHHPSEARGALHVTEVTSGLTALGMAGSSLADARGLIQALTRWEAQRDAHAAGLARREAWEMEARGIRARLEAADASGLEELEAQLTRVHIYDVLVERYTSEFATWAQHRDTLTDLRREERSWRNGKLALDELREETKNYIVPALSRVASYMISKMTGGQRTRIVVDEDFEIEVDGQPLNTLSGSGKVCANLAIRLGLGRILTNSVFPVFAGDEMDASMDDDRAEHLHSALVTMQDKIAQILIITHKAPTCPHVIKLER